MEAAAAKEASLPVIFFPISGREGHSRRERNVRANDRVSAVHVIFLVEEMHRTAEALRAAGRFAKEFGHTRVGAGSARERVSVIAICGDDVIVLAHRGDGTDDNRFLADVKMAEAADFLRLILLARAFLKAPNQQHQREHLDLVALLGPLHYLLCDASQCTSTMPARFTPA